MDKKKIIIFVILLILVIIIEFFGQYYLSKAAKNNDIGLMFVGIILFAFMGLFYYFCLSNYDNVGIVNGLWSVASVLGVSFIVGYFFMNEKFTILQIIGIIVMAIGGLLIIPY